jgi:hypothetical protein
MPNQSMKLSEVACTLPGTSFIKHFVVIRDASPLGNTN